MHRPILTSTAVSILALLLAGCGDSRSDAGASASAGANANAPASANPGAKPTPGSYSEGGALSPFYGEELHQDNGRIYLFGTKPGYARFTSSGEINEQRIKTFIGIGPNGETVVAETSKENPAITDRLIRTFRARYGLTAEE